MTTYNANIPTGTVNLDEDYINLRNNFQQLNTSFGKDHYEFDNATSSNGYHKAVHLVQQVAPAAVAGAGSLYCTTVNDGINNDQTLYYKTGANRIIQLTRNFVPVAASSGYTFLPGGLIIQWATIAAVGTTLTSRTFTSMSLIPFPNSCFSMQATMYDAAATGTNVLILSSVTATGFKYYNTSSSAKTFFILAIGN